MDFVPAVQDELPLAETVEYSSVATSSLSAQFKRASVKLQRELLPIFHHKNSFLYLIETSQVVVLVGHTGSGKSTQLPQYLYEVGWCTNNKLIACTQPRRVAAISVAQRVAEEMDCAVGSTVGYSIRFEDMTSDKTKIKYLTDGMLLRELLVDPLLQRYSVIIIDEAHERTVYTDILLCVLKKVLKKRRDLRLIIASATLQAEEFVSYFEPAAKCMSIEGKLFPIDHLYLQEPTENYVTEAVKTILSIHQSEPDGDILVFLTGREEINSALQFIHDQSGSLQSTSRLLALPLYAGLSRAEQTLIFEPAPENSRKVILSTNVAEASVTIDGIVYVVDCGFVKLRYYDPKLKQDSLIMRPISKASAIQRAGRAGRTRSGKCFRLYTSAAAKSLENTTVPELQRVSLLEPIMSLKSLGIENIARIDLISPPSVKLLANDLELLHALGAIDSDARLTKPDGERMAELPIHPMMAKALLESSSKGCLDPMLTIAAMSCVDDVFVIPKNDKREADRRHREFMVDEGDHLTFYNVYQAFTNRGKQSSRWCTERYLNYTSLSQAVRIRAQLARYLSKFGIFIPSTSRQATPETIVRCLVCGYFSNAARMQANGSYNLVSASENGEPINVSAHPHSSMFSRSADWVIYMRILKLGAKNYIGGITKVERDWLVDSAPGYYKVKSTSKMYDKE
ncbi:P-loop containing nucleoside triphosphate hydrolase protein [Lipomyces oligophaga]|uniref:P-loop containing nucleoside triphosphate hydrolase protein n=1 Tax=Lipomyces oligophaga TaxID=45792 RepID=UPI0034CDEC74